MGQAHQDNQSQVKWKYASSSDRRLFDAISFLFQNRPDLLDFVFHPSQPSLSMPSDKIKKIAKSLSDSDQLLIRIALDIWNDSGLINFSEIYQKLDNHNVFRVIQTLSLLSTGALSF